jgi:hypothetical protein
MKRNWMQNQSAVLKGAWFNSEHIERSVCRPQLCKGAEGFVQELVCFDPRGQGTMSKCVSVHVCVSVHCVHVHV